MLDEVGLVVREIIGILPPLAQDETEAAVAGRYGSGAAAFYRRMRDFCPEALLGPVVATALGDAATEVLYICSRRPA